MAVLEQAVASGRPLQDVAEELGRSLNAVQIRRNRHFPTPKPEPGMNHGWSPGLGRIEKYWTSERVIAGLRDFASQRPGLLPNSDHDYSAAKKGHLEWPTAASVLALFGTMANAWAGIGAPKVRYTRKWNEWTQEDDDYLLEHAGEQTLKIIGKHLGRSWPSCKRRLYDLGAGRARDASGHMSAMQVAKEYGCPLHRVTALIARGELKAKKVYGGHYWRVDPEDAEAIAEKLRAPKRTYRKRPADIGDYDRRYGLRRVSINGRIVRVVI